MAVAFLNSNSAGVVSGGTISAAQSVTNAGAQRVAFAVFAWDGTNSDVTTGPTYGGQLMTACGSKAVSNTGTTQQLKIFYLVNPPTGSNTLAAVVAPTPTETYFGLVAFTGVDQVMPVRSGSYQATINALSNNGTPNTYSITIASNPADLTMTGLIDDRGATGTNQTLDLSNTGGILEMFSDHATVPAASVTHIWTFLAGAAANLALVGFSIQAAQTGAGTSRLLCGVGS